MDRTEYRNGFHASVTAMEHLQNEFTDPLTAIGKYFGNGVLWYSIDTSSLGMYGWYVHKGEILPFEASLYPNGGHIVEEYVANTLSDGTVVANALVKRKIVPIEDGESFPNDETIDILHARRFAPNYLPHDGAATYGTLASGLATMTGTEVASLGISLPLIEQTSPMWQFAEGILNVKAFIKKDTSGFSSSSFLHLSNYSFGRIVTGKAWVRTTTGYIFEAPLWINYSGDVYFNDALMTATMISSIQNMCIWGVFN